MKRMDQINVIPFIDIMLVLLAIVLTTATFIVEGRLQIRLPAATSQTPPPAVERVEIAVDAAGGLFLGGEPLGSGSRRPRRPGARGWMPSPWTPPSSCGSMPRPASSSSSPWWIGSRAGDWNGSPS